jgi:hypothetical protein
MVCIGDKRLERKRGINCVAKQFVHLPVSGDYGFSHLFIVERVDAGQLLAREEFERGAAAG